MVKRTAQKQNMSAGGALVARGGRGTMLVRLLLALSAVAVACTLTDDKFDPNGVELGQAPDLGSQSDAGGADAASPCNDPRGCCEVDEDCGSEQTCIQGFCETTSCDGAEDVSACELPICTGPSCPTPPLDGPASCTDEIQNGDEAGIDCGRSCSSRCGTGSSCSDNLDCASFNCPGSACAAATCTDGIRNQDETDIDCGGSCEADCPAGDACELDGDCQAGLFCPPTSTVCTDDSCQDLVQNGNEVAVDCGGGGCPGCVPGTPCGDDVDCDSFVCGADGACAEPSCDDGRQNQNETGLDCGGDCNETCADGTECTEAADCNSGVCAAGGCTPGVELCCQEPTCNDGVRNGNEPAVDCGSVQSCGLCQIGQGCTANAQCQTRICNGTCQPRPPCDDGVVTGDESDVDCGGTDPACDGCLDGDRCRFDNDCASDICDGGFCVSCSDNEENGAETGEDCGGPDCGNCPDGQGCNNGGDCQSGTCGPGGVCITPNCNDNLENGSETDVDCGGSDPECDRCGDGDDCNVGGDCQSGICQGNICVSCDDNVRNGTETAVDCGGNNSACARCGTGQACGVDSDCASGACAGGTCCGGTQRDCTRCAERLSPGVDCSDAADGPGITNCNNYLQCLASNAVCVTRDSCSAQGQICNANNFGGPGGTGVVAANLVLNDAGCQ